MPSNLEALIWTDLILLWMGFNNMNTNLLPAMTEQILPHDLSEEEHKKVPEVLQSRNLEMVPRMIYGLRR